VIIDACWIDDRIGLFDTPRDYTLQFIITQTHTRAHSNVYTGRWSVAASYGGRSPSSEFPIYTQPQLPVPHSNSSQRLNLSISETD
jgi:hypothetical protein